MPQTGTTNTGYLNLIGMLILSGSLLLILLNKNKKQEEIYNEIN
ncbi:LPXTG cell wall anchor domain-containing protein [Carnobacterium maltaromaticum]|nr:LPXTG cell wall anchor domain-containing protein [Carnobacterium maltaromaticum]